MRLRFLVGLLVVSTPLSIGGSALAAPPPGATQQNPPASPKPKDHADELFDQGTAAFDAGRFAEAEAKFEEAWALKQTHDIAGNLGIVELQLGKTAEAAKHLSWALQHLPPTEASSTRKGLEQELQKARAVASSVRIRVNVVGAEITVNGRAVGKSPLVDEVFVEPGKNVVEVKCAGYEDSRQVVDVKAGGSASVELTQKKIEGRPPLSSGPSVPLVVGGAAISVAVIATGAALFAVAGGKGSSADQMVTQLNSDSAQLCPKPATIGACADLFSLRQDQQSFHNAGVVLLVGGSAVAVGTLAYALWPRGKRATADALLVPVVSTSGAGIWLHGTF